MNWQIRVLNSFVIDSELSGSFYQLESNENRKSAPNFRGESGVQIVMCSKTAVYSSNNRATGAIFLTISITPSRCSAVSNILL